MKTYTTLTNLFTSLTNNESATNQTLGGQLISDQHRYLLQKYFDNENQYFTQTVGAETITFTAAPAIGDTSATLTTAWGHTSTSQLVTFSTSDQRTVYFYEGSTNVTWQPALTAASTTSVKTIGVQAYPIPPNVSKIKNDTITIGQLQYTPAPVRSIGEWTYLNMLPYTSNIPNYYYIYNNQVLFWPIPSNTGNVITFNYKSRVPDLSFSDYLTGTLSGLTQGSTSVTGVATAWNTTGKYPLNTDLTPFSLYLRIEPPNGDGIWYPIERFTSDTALNLLYPLQTVPSATATTYTIGQLPLLHEDFHDMLVYGALMVYFSSIAENPTKYKQFEMEYEKRLTLLEDYAGTKSVNVNLGKQPQPKNPNLYLYA